MNDLTLIRKQAINIIWLMIIEFINNKTVIYDAVPTT